MQWFINLLTNTFESFVAGLWENLWTNLFQVVFFWLPGV